MSTRNFLFTFFLPLQFSTPWVMLITRILKNKWLSNLGNMNESLLLYLFSVSSSAKLITETVSFFIVYRICAKHMYSKSYIYFIMLVNLWRRIYLKGILEMEHPCQDFRCYENPDILFPSCIHFWPGATLTKCNNYLSEMMKNIPTCIFQKKCIIFFTCLQ